jgi:energy-coupling factor transport system substrate-specific component
VNEPGPVKERTRIVITVIVCTALNFGGETVALMGHAASMPSVPFELYALGTVLATVVCGLWIGLATGLIYVLIRGALDPIVFVYSANQLVIVVCVVAMQRVGYLKTLWSTLLGGLILGLLSATVSAPVDALVWEDASLSGPGGIAAFMDVSWHIFLNDVVRGSFSNQPLQLLVTSVVAYALLRLLPENWRGRLEHLER